MSKATQNTTAQVASATAAKKVTKKSDAPVAAAPAPVAIEVKAEKKVAKKAKEEAKPAAVTVAAPAAQPVAEAASAQQVEVPSVDQEIATLITNFQSQRDHAVSAIKSLQKLQKRVAKDLKEASKRKRKSAKVVDENAPKRPTIFTTPVTLKDELCHFLGKPKGFQMTPAEVTRAFSAYVEEKKLKDAEKGHTIHPDAAMRKLFGIKDGEQLSYRTVQAHLYKNYQLPQKKVAISAQ